jgi:soluble lytic murein transglycosylase-like protein
MKRFLLMMAFMLPGRTILASPVDAEKCVRIYAARYHVPPTFVAALIDVESRWNPRAVSEKGAMGLMQLMPATARRFGAFDPFNVEQNIAAGTRYVTALMWEFNGDLRLVAATYYAGDHGIERVRLNCRNPDIVAYVQAVKRCYEIRSSRATRQQRRSMP